MSPWCAELYDSLRTTVASTNGSPRRARSAASSSSSARIALDLPFDPRLDAFQVLGHVQVGQRGGGPRHLDGLRPVRLHHPLAAAVAAQGAQLLEERPPVKD